MILIFRQRKFLEKRGIIYFLSSFDVLLKPSNRRRSRILRFIYFYFLYHANSFDFVTSIIEKSSAIIPFLSFTWSSRISSVSTYLSHSSGNRTIRWLGNTVWRTTIVPMAVYTVVENFVPMMSNFPIVHYTVSNIRALE